MSYFDGDRVQDGGLYTSYSGDELSPVRRKPFWQRIRDALAAVRRKHDQ